MSSKALYRKTKMVVKIKRRLRNWKVPKEIKVSYKEPDTNIKKQITLNGLALLNAIINVINSYEKINLKLTNREIYYQLVAQASIPNVNEVYKRICKLITDARYGGFIDWEAVEDRSRDASMHSQWDDVPDLIESAVSSYRLKRWDDQYYYVEMYCEKEAGEGKLKPIADKYHIYFGANKGYSSASMIYRMAERIKEKLSFDKKVRILYFGDHDPSGLDMIRDIHDRIKEFIVNSDDNPYYGEEELFEEDFKIIPVALNLEQIKEYGCPPNPAKITDPRAKWYIEKYGKVSWELDALKPNVLIDLAENAVLDYLDLDKYEEIIAKEKKDIVALREFGEEYQE